MKEIRLSDYDTSNASGKSFNRLGLESDIKSCENNHEPWIFIIDMDQIWISSFSTAIPWYPLYDNGLNDFDYLEEIVVDHNVDDYKAIDGCLLDKDAKLIYAPKCRRLSLNNVNAISEDHCVHWNKSCSLLLRTILDSYIIDNSLKSYFEKILLIYVDNITYLLRDMIQGHRYLHIMDRNFHVQLDSVEISDKIKRERYGADIDDEVRSKILAIDEEIGTEALLPFEQLILGEYYHDDKKIVLYVNAMQLTGKTGIDLQDLFISIFVHEMFHALHASCVDSFNQQSWNNGFQNDNNIIKESLASYYEYLFRSRCLGNSVLADELKNSWDAHHVLIYPYSGAKEMFVSDVKKRRLSKWWHLVFVHDSINSSKSVIYSKLQDLHHRLYRLANDDALSFFVLSLTSLDYAESELLKKALSK